MTTHLADSMVIRQMKAHDLPRLEWDGELIHLRRLFLQAYHQYQAGNAVLWVVELPGVGIVAQVFVQLKGHQGALAGGQRQAFIYGFRVRGAFRGQGVGTRLMAVVEEDLRQRGYSSVYLNVGQENQAALRLYERLGYRIVSPEPGQWSYLDHLGRRVDVDEPSWRMEKSITAW
jgi:ribosomal protein S18 acetylase RimI-like enzyme